MLPSNVSCVSAQTTSSSQSLSCNKYSFWQSFRKWVCRIPEMLHNTGLHHIYNPQQGTGYRYTAFLILQLLCWHFKDCDYPLQSSANANQAGDVSRTEPKLNLARVTTPVRQGSTSKRLSPAHPKSPQRGFEVIDPTTHTVMLPETTDPEFPFVVSAACPVLR